jgi:FecR protein
MGARSGANDLAGSPGPAPGRALRGSAASPAQPRVRPGLRRLVLLAALGLALGGLPAAAWSQAAAPAAGPPSGGTGGSGGPPAGGEAVARTRYGDATVEQGSMTLVRDGHNYDYAVGQPTVVVVYGDLVVVHGDSRVVVETADGARLTIGANAAFQVKPFRQRETLGVLRLLFGRMRAKLAQLREGQEFGIKTAQAVIGVKGTEFVTSVTAQGDTLVVVQETQNKVDLTGLEGPTRTVAPDLMAAVVNSKPVSNVALVTPQVARQLVLTDLSAPVAYSPQAKSLRGEQALVQTGIVSAKDLVESRRDRASLQDAVPFDEQAPPLRQRYQPRTENAQPFLRWNLLLRQEP